jgi:hypothetical protein
MKDTAWTDYRYIKYRTIEEMNMIKVHYKHVWKYHNDKLTGDS